MSEKLPNGMTIAYIDESRKIAADRWLVRLRCQASIPLQEWMEDALNGDDGQGAFCLDQFKGQLRYETVMERNFIDDGERAELLMRLRHSFDENALTYLAREAFVRQLFAARQAEYNDRYLLQMKSSSLPETDDDRPEPDDFSACFQ